MDGATNVISAQTTKSPEMLIYNKPNLLMTKKKTRKCPSLGVHANLFQQIIQSEGRPNVLIRAAIVLIRTAIVLIRTAIVLIKIAIVLIRTAIGGRAAMGGNVAAVPDPVPDPSRI